MLLEWCEKDPVDDWEIARNDKVYKIQGNRNPFGRSSELAEYIWGDKTDTEWYPEDNNEPAIISPKDKSEIDLGMTAVNYPLSRELLIKVRNPEGNISLSVSGTGFSVSPETITAEEGKIGKNVTLAYTTAIGRTVRRKFNRFLRIFDCKCRSESPEAVDGHSRSSSYGHYKKFIYGKLDKSGTHTGYISYGISNLIGFSSSGISENSR